MLINVDNKFIILKLKNNVKLIKNITHSNDVPLLNQRNKMDKKCSIFAHQL